MTTREQRITDAGRKAVAQHRVDLGHHLDDLALHTHATALAQSNIDELDCGRDDPQAYIVEFVSLYTQGYLAEIKFSQEMRDLGKQWSAEKQAQQEQEIAAMTREKAIATLRKVSQTLIEEEYMYAANQVAIIVQWLEQQAKKSDGLSQVSLDEYLTS